MKKLLFLLILVGVLSVNSIVSAEIITTKSGSIIYKDVSLKTTFVNQDPYPAEPNAYVNLVFKLENWGTEKAENTVFELLPEYPFSLDNGVSATKELGTINGVQTNQNAFLIKYKVRVDKDALDDESEIGVKCTYNYAAENGAVVTDKFNVTVSNPRTDFDVVVQDSTAGTTTLAIANIGANTGYSLIVRIPEQQNFGVTGTSANIIGNLNAGDYTLVSFQITSNTGIANITGKRGNIPPTGGNMTQIRPSFNRTASNISMVGGGNLAVEISYTDTLGIRRTVQKEVRLDASGTTRTGTITRSTTQGTQLQLPSGGLMYIGIGVVGIIVIVVIFRLRRKRKKK
jgi:hypothetical protein